MPPLEVSQDFDLLLIYPHGVPAWLIYGVVNEVNDLCF